MEQKQQPQQPNSTQAPQPKKPNEVGSLQIDGFVKIFDPNTKEVYVEKRA